ncbi:translation initiation factor IF-1 [Candidatus Campbellbacteria bacterium]|nr:MAG: translation initiation factor IF-1 [Candidatus Campbellbacteria bacterium]
MEEVIKQGIVTESLPNTMFRIKFDDQEDEHIAYLGGRMKRFRIRILVGDKVEVKMDEYGGKGRIIKRL